MAGTVLDAIIAGVLEDLKPRRAAVPVAELEALAQAAPGALDAASALAAPGLSVIAEVKRASPSKGELASIPAPAELADAYAAGGASAISVLTEQRRFRGSLADLDQVRAAVDIPVLRKEFTVDPYLIWEARAHGADLVLLIVAALSDNQLLDYLALVRDLGMAAIVEVHDERETERAVAAGARIIGVNARNLKTLTVDPGVFARLRPMIPGSIITIAESGIGGPREAQAYYQLGADAVLVGESLVRGADPRAAVEAMRKAAVHD